MLFTLNWLSFWWEIPLENAGNGISTTLNFKIFWEAWPPTPLVTWASGSCLHSRLPFLIALLLSKVVTALLTMGNCVQRSCTGTQRKKETGCDHKPPSCLYCRESCRVFHTLEKTRNFFHKKKLCYTVSMRIMGQTTARVAHVSSLSRDTTRACATSLGQMEQVTAWCSLHTALARKIDRYRPSYCWRFKEPLCGVTWKRATSNQEDKSDPYTPWDTPNRYYQRCP